MATQLAATPNASQVPSSVASGFEISFAGAQAVAAQYPQWADQIIAGAKVAFLAGDQSAYLAGIIAILVGAALVIFFFPKKEKEHKLLREYHAADVQ
jgi:MFS transporter, DHA2 family, multidrug resistance protein